MSQFYARYVPPATDIADAGDSDRPEKRKRIDTDSNQGKRTKDKKRKRSKDDGVLPSKECRSGEFIKNPRAKQLANGGLKDKTALPKESVTEAAPESGAPVTKHRKLENFGVQAEGEPTESIEGTVKKKDKRKEKKSKADQEEQTLYKTADDDHDRKHAKLLSKFSTSKTKSDTFKENRTTVEDEPFEQERHGLVPIPQPPESELPKPKPAYSILPSWQTHVVKVVHSDRRKFADLALSHEMVQNLLKAGIDESFPIQTTVLPLLLDGKDRYSGDVCVSAATGSGKTLAYVLPVIEDLKRFPTTSLRGVIVVPTRELVKQVRQLCDTCVAGTTLKVATAAGSKSLKEEQASLVLEEEIYNPEEYRKQQRAPIDWSSLSIEQLLRDSASQHARPVDHVMRFRSKADILVTTPGRLVEHLQSTPGFNLDYVKWLIVDEADRLLNESYQEWIDIVVPALQSHQATKNRDDLLRQMRISVPERAVQKVLLSATMTRDISKLNSLGLVDPKLVVLGNAALESERMLQQPRDLNEDTQAGPDGAFHLPGSLFESVIPIKEGSEKPLYLLNLLEKKIIGSLASVNRKPSHVESAESSSDDSDSSVSEFTSSSGSDSEDDGRPGAFIKKARTQHTPSAAIPTQTRALIFTRSTSSAERLSRLLTLLSPATSPLISTLTRSSASSSNSRRALRAFRSSRTAVLIATDRASRGLDIPNLQHVISYDVPSSALTYVHRVGRTARAGKEGTAWTLVEHREGAWFWREIGGKEGKQGKKADVKIVRREKPRKVNLELDDDDDGMKKRYEEALKQLGEEVRRQ